METWQDVEGNIFVNHNRTFIKHLIWSELFPYPLILYVEIWNLSTSEYKHIYNEVISVGWNPVK